ncbi:MAG: hypothetical protein ACKVVT_17680 [Dehalococcoidia bacterium]
MCTSLWSRVATVLFAVVATFGGLAVTAGPAAADRGVSLTIGRFQIDQKLTKGREYTLAGFGVKNPGTELTNYRLGLMHVSGETLAPDAWFAFETETVTVAPGASQPVAVKLVVPGSARPGKYKAYLRAEIASEGSGTSVGAAAAAPVTFEVKSTNTLEEWRFAAGDAVAASSPWSFIGAGAATVAALAWFLRRNLTISVGRKA